MVGIHILMHRYNCSDDRMLNENANGSASAGSTPSKAV
jgi:hypothetical protein